MITRLLAFTLFFTFCHDCFGMEVDTITHESAQTTKTQTPSLEDLKKTVSKDFYKKNEGSLVIFANKKENLFELCIHIKSSKLKSDETLRNTILLNNEKYIKYYNQHYPN